MRVTQLLLLLAAALTTVCNAELSLEDIIAKEQEWAKRALERRGHVLAGSSYLDELLNMDHYIAIAEEQPPLQKNSRVPSKTADDVVESKKSLRGR
jgi:hypothetical protein